MTSHEIISALEALVDEAKLAERKINYSSQLERLERRVKQLEERLDGIEEL
jgi:hypothetical protein